MGQHPKEFLVFLLAVLCAGIFLGHCWQGGAEYAPCIWAGVWACLCLAALAVRRGHGVSWLAVGACIFLLGLGRYYAVAVLAEDDIGRMAGQRVKLEGRLTGAPEITVDEAGGLHVRYEVECEKLAGRGSIRGRLIVYGNEGSLHSRDIMAQVPVKRRDGEERADWEMADRAILGRSGDRLCVSGTVKALRDYGNPGRMNREMSLLARGIHGQLMADKYSLQLLPEEGDWLARLSERIRSAYREYMERAMPKQDAAAVFAMLFGGYQGIRPELLEAFTITGIVHILSVSGSHITLMAGTAGILGRLLHLPDKVTAGMGVVTIVFYGVLAGAIPPVVRSALMGILTLLALTLGREKDARHLLSIVALGLLLYSPPLLYDISFQLSFGATAGLLYIAPVLRGWLRKRLPVFAADSLAVTMGAQVSVLPLLAWYFNAVSISSLLANLIITPVVEWIIVIGLLAGIAGSLLPLAGHLVFMGAALLLGLVYELSRLTASLPFSQVYVPAPELFGCTVYYGGLGWLIAPAGTRAALAERVKGSAFLTRCALLTGFLERRQEFRPVLPVVVAILLLSAGYGSFSAADRLQVHFIDVGQGDAALVITPHGHAFMVDAGGVREGDYDIGRMVDVPYLLHYGVRQLDYIFLTHAHDDHAAGVRGILGRIPVRAVMIGHEGAGEYLKAFGRGEAGRTEKLLAPLKENTYMELDGVRIEVLYSPERREVMQGSVEATGNEYSNLIRVSYGDASFLFTGDLVAAQEAELLRRGTSLRSTVLKVGHHGSRTSSSEGFLQAVKPGWAVISCGYGNSFGHPHKEIVQRIADVTGAEILRTDEKGAVVFRTDGKSMSVECYRD